MYERKNKKEGIKEMDIDEVKKYCDKKCIIVLKNDFKYTIIIPQFNGSSFSVKDKYNTKITIDCSYIALIKELHDDDTATTPK